MRRPEKIWVDIVSDRIGAVVVVTVAGELTFDLEVFGQTLFIADRRHLSIADSESESAAIERPATP